MKLSKEWVIQHQYELLLAIVLLLSFIVFLVVLPDYGMSYDERDLYEYADRMVDAYVKMAYGEPIDRLLQFYDLQYYGPFFLVIGRLVIYGLNSLFPALTIVHAWHIVTFITFLVGVWMISLLASRFIEKKFALFASLLFLTQPLLWGHGAINLKDIPFLTFFLISVLIGIKWVDALRDSDWKTESGLHIRLSRKTLFYGVPALILFLSIFVDRLFSNFISSPIVSRLLSALFYSQNGFFQRLIGSDEPLAIQNYISKTLRLVNLVEIVILLAVLLLFLFIMAKQVSPLWKFTVLAGVFSGFALGVRVLGPASAGLVVLYLLVSKPRRPFWWLLSYFAITFFIAYLVWPYLWGQPIQGLLNSLGIMSKFPWRGNVRFEGIEIPAGDLPWYYLPKLIGIQFTIPLVILSLIGFFFLVRASVRKKPIWRQAIIIIAWFWLPIIGVVVARPTMYDNFRQFLFITPPLFISAGYAAGILLYRLKRRLQTAIVILLILPGIIAGAWLHPYEYVYYSGFVGWTGSIGRNYENDYWATATCEAADYLSSQSDEPDVIYFTDMVLLILFQHCAANEFDLRVERAQYPTPLPDYALSITRFDHDLDYYRNMNTFYTIKRGNTPFLVIKR